MMTKEALVELVNSKKNKGQLTEEDVLEIGIAHRELPKPDRSWAWVADLIDWQGTPNSLRNYILRHSNCFKSSIYSSFKAPIFIR